MLVLPLEGHRQHIPDQFKDTAPVRSHIPGPSPLQVSSSPEPRRIRVLMVDDHTLLRQGLRTIITGYDHLEVVGEAANGLEAIQMANRLQPDVIVMDINMPKLDGIEATRFIKASHQKIAIVALSVHESADMMQRINEAGAVDYLTKETASNDLCKAIEAAAGSTTQTERGM